MRALHTRNAVVFWGKVLDGKAPPQRRLYLLDLDRDEYRPVGDQDLLLDNQPLAVCPRDDFACTVVQAQDAFHVIRISLAGSSRPETLLTLMTRVAGLDVDGAGQIYLDQVQRPLEVIRFAASNRLCAELDYVDEHGRRSVRTIQPYSLRQTQAGDILLHADRADSQQHRTYRIDRIVGARATQQTFTPRYAVELTPMGPISVPPAMYTPRVTAPRPRQSCANGCCMKTSRFGRTLLRLKVAATCGVKSKMR